MTIIRKLAAWFTPVRRQLIQGLFGALAPLIIWAGFATQTQAEQWLIIVGAVLQFVASLLSLINLRGLLSIWKVLRGALYTLGMAVAPTLTVLGYTTAEQSAQLLVGISLVLSVVSSVVAIIVGQAQALEADDAGEG